MNIPFQHKIVQALLLQAFALAACAPAASSQPRVFFIEPANGATVSAPVQVKLGAENFTIEPAGDIHGGPVT